MLNKECYEIDRELLTDIQPHPLVFTSQIETEMMKRDENVLEKISLLTSYYRDYYHPKCITYDGPTILPTPSPLPKEVERETETTKDKVKNTNLGSTAHVQPLIVQDLISEPEVATKTNPKPSIPYPLRLNDQKPREKANNQMLKFLQIFQRLHFDISFTDALLYMPKFASTFKSLLTDFVVVDYEVDPRVPLILGRLFLRTARALIDVHGEEMTLRVNYEAITFKVGHTSRYSQNYYDETVHQVNVIDVDVACEEYA
ncbi:hypothetical protein Tco_0323805 [Tanacetum coccineum]